MKTVSSRLDLETINLFGKVLKEKRSEVVRELVNAGKKHKAVELYKTKKVSLGLGAKLAKPSILLEECFKFKLPINFVFPKFIS